MAEVSDDDSLEGLFHGSKPSTKKFKDSGVNQVSSSLTLDGIRRLLKEPKYDHRIDEELTEMARNVQNYGEGYEMDGAIRRAVELLEQLLELSLLLSAERNEANGEATRVRESVKELEDLLDSRTERELGYLNQVQSFHNDKLTKKYKTLTLRAREHVLETQHQIEQLTVKIEKRLERIHSVREEYSYLQRVMTSQQEEIYALKEASKNGVSERDLTDLRIRLLRLQEENSKLQMEKTKIQQQVDEFEEKVNKKSASLSSYMRIDNSFHSKHGDAEEVKAQIAKHQKAVSKLQADVIKQDTQHDKQKEQLKGDSKHFQEYVCFLMKAIEEQSA